jgi:hypothetical protein
MKALHPPLVKSQPTVDDGLNLMHLAARMPHTSLLIFTPPIFIT